MPPVEITTTVAAALSAVSVASSVSSVLPLWDVATINHVGFHHAGKV
jgi:hypothetical protein